MHLDELLKVVGEKKLLKDHLTHVQYIWGFPKMVVPPKHPKMIIFSRKTHGCWVPPF